MLMAKEVADSILNFNFRRRTSSRMVSIHIFTRALQGYASQDGSRYRESQPGPGLNLAKVSHYEDAQPKSGCSTEPTQTGLSQEKHLQCSEKSSSTMAQSSVFRKIQ